MSRSAREYLQHIIDETSYLILTSQGLSQDEFTQNETLKRAYARSLEIIGEAVKYLPDEVRQQHSGIDWRAIAGMRDRLIHHYFGIDYDIVWDVVINKVPQLDAEIREILNDIS
ncbi:MAG: DUF86 domain-containing protein [Limnothrix sp. BL-A-16]|jgi:uncharacterized protein with HEPN domain